MSTTMSLKTAKAIREVQVQVHTIAIENGFWDNPINDGECIALMHSDLSEALEEIRNDKIEWKNVAAELADCVIRIFDYAQGRGLDIATAIADKMDINRRRHKMYNRRF